MRTLIAAILCLLALPATAQNLQGQWRMDVPAQPGYAGVILIDAEGRVTMDSPADYGRPAKYRGYVGRGEGGGVKIVITDGGVVAFIYCAIESSERLHCYASRASGSKSDTFLMGRVGPGPRNLMQAHQ